MIGLIIILMIGLKIILVIKSIILLMIRLIIKFNDKVYDINKGKTYNKIK